VQPVPHDGRVRRAAGGLHPGHGRFFFLVWSTQAHSRIGRTWRTVFIEMVAICAERTPKLIELDNWRAENSAPDSNISFDFTLIK
jgi:hypothetical protein